MRENYNRINIKELNNPTINLKTIISMRISIK
jgi:hypothetical protein